MDAAPEDDLTLGCDTAAQLFRARAIAWGETPALRWKARGIWHSASWRDYYESARAIGLALADAGVARGEVVTVLSENRPEWLYADLGAQCMGMTGNGIYPTASAEQVRYLLENSQTRVVMVEDDEQLDKVLQARARCPLLRAIVVMDTAGLRGLSDPMVTDFAALLVRGRRLALADSAQFEAAIDAGRPDDIAFLVYTSGTTGPPKGAMIAQKNLIFQLGTVRQYLTVQRGDKTLSFLPLCHIAERMATTFNQLALGTIVHFPENAGTVANDMREVRPHMVFARLAFSNLRDYLGLSEVKNAITGAAPVPPDLLKWYLAIGIDLIEGFGMTETTGFVCATPPSRLKLGYAGKSAPGVEVRLGANDEILVRGGNVFAGYWGLPDETARAIDNDGWLHTGDCGEIDADGYLAIRDRIKDIIITSGGKNITPSGIENQLKFSPYIADAVVIGEARNYLTCLVMIDQESVARYAQEAQVPFTDFASLTQADEVVRLIGAEIETVNARLARVEQIKAFRILALLLSAEDEELTPTMKLKRRVVAAKYGALIESMYR